MDTLKVDDVLALYIFKCEVCRRRLQSPVFKVDAFGNICGICHAVSVYTNVQRNIQMEMLLSKLYVSCNFAENGCSYEGPYDKTITHEEICRFRRRRCPLVYQLNCEFEFVNSDDIMKHIRNVHEKDILKVENNPIELKNPSESFNKVFYLLDVDNVLILLGTMLKPAKDRTYYISYHFGKKEVSLLLEFKQRQEILTTVHESEFNFKFDTRNAFKIMLEECDLLVRIRFPIQNKKACRNADNILQPGNPVGARCCSCSKFCEKQVSYCPTCYKVFCKTCSRSCGCNGCSYSLDLVRLQVNNGFRCTNTDCEQIIPLNVYDVHRLYHCPFNTNTCSLKGCEWTGCFKNFVEHKLEKHSLSINKKMQSLKTNTYSENYFVNGDDVFFHKYVLSTQNKLDIITAKITEPLWASSYTWIIKIKSMCENNNMALTGDYSINLLNNNYLRQINVENYMNGDTLILETYVRRN